MCNKEETFGFTAEQKKRCEKRREKNLVGYKAICMQIKAPQ